jgi:DMSO/TMAO reductase YedYZ molybdopterin-dependent catalytic subunit
MKVRIPQEGDFRSRLRSPAVTARVGLWLGICFGVAFVTGLVSHWAKIPHPWVPFPTRPVWGYRVTQGLHVISGTAAVPLLLVKLWTVYPKLFARPPRRVGELVAHGAERVSIAVLVAAAVFQLVTGLANAAEWYPWRFSFSRTHYAVGWIAVGALVLHVAVKLPLIRAALGTDVESNVLDRPSTAPAAGVLSRRGLLRTTWAATGVAVLATAGSTVPLLRQVSVLAVRSGDGPQHLPVRTSAATARVTASATSAAYRLTVVHEGREDVFTHAELGSLPQTTASLPIACVEGWSAGATWSGVRMRDLLDHVGAPRGRDVEVFSLQQQGAFRNTRLPDRYVDDPETLLALELNGESLSLDHGFPCRVIAPDRPGELQTKWVTRLEVQS